VPEKYSEVLFAVINQPLHHFRGVMREEESFLIH